jgi:putative membrane protein
MFYMHSFGWGWWLVMSIGMVAFWGLVIYGVVWVLRGRSPQRAEQPARERPQEILKQRLAQGEISAEEYERLTATIERPAQRAPARASAGVTSAGKPDRMLR